MLKRLRANRGRFAFRATPTIGLNRKLLKMRQIRFLT
jgi:hypothetical protein